MKIRVVFAIVAVFCVFNFGNSIVLAQGVSSESVPVEITGFGDFYYAIGQDRTQADDFALGQVELDLAATIDDKIVIETAVAYDAQGETLNLGGFIVDFHLFGSEGEHFRTFTGINHSGIIVGAFDVPFGIDWNVYSSIDRKLISGPLAVENTHNFWGDSGVLGYAEAKWINAVFYGANGFGYEGTDSTGNPVDVDMKVAFGGRIGIAPHEIIELGGSYAGFLNQTDKLDMSLMVADCQISYEGYSIKGEYIVHGIALAGENNMTNTGFYIQGMYDFGIPFLVARYGVFSPDEENTNELTRLSVGAGLTVRENCELRFEYRANSEDDDDAAFMLSVGF